jgi:ferredoxin
MVNKFRLNPNSNYDDNGKNVLIFIVFMVDFHICYILQELVVGLSEEPGEENSLSGKKGLKVENKKTKKMKREELKEISNGNNVDEACEKKKLKKPKLCNGVSDCEVKRNANAEMEPKVEENHGMIRSQMDGPVVMGGGDNASAMSQTNAIVLNAQKIKEEIPLPLGTEMTKILDIEFAPEDVGNALQFLEFCRVFGKVCLIMNIRIEFVVHAI